MGLVDEHEDGVILVEDREVADLGSGVGDAFISVGPLLARIEVALLILLDNGEDQPRPSLSEPPLGATFTVSPESSAVSESCFWRSVRSVTRTTLKRRSSGIDRSFRTRKTMVRLLPLPWVCQMMPPRRSCWPSWAFVLPVSSRPMAACTARYCW